MRKQIHQIIIVSLVVQGCSILEHKQTSVAAQQVKVSNIREEKLQKPLNVAAPEECLTKTREFIAYIFRREPDLGKDEEAQGRWLSEGLRKGLRHARNTYLECVKGVPETALREEL